jgi:hypothetical protein
MQADSKNRKKLGLLMAAAIAAAVSAINLGKVGTAHIALGFIIGCGSALILVGIAADGRNVAISWLHSISSALILVGLGVVLIGGIGLIGHGVYLSFH